MQDDPYRASHAPLAEPDQFGNRIPHAPLLTIATLVNLLLIVSAVITLWGLVLLGDLMLLHLIFVVLAGLLMVIGGVSIHREWPRTAMWTYAGASLFALASLADYAQPVMAITVLVAAICAYFCSRARKPDRPARIEPR